MRVPALALLAAAASCGAPRYVVPPYAGLAAPVLGGVLSIRFRQPLREHGVFDYDVQELATPAADDHLVFVGSSGGTFYALDRASGQAVWKFPVGASISSLPLLAGDEVAFGADDGVLYVLGRADGKQRWTYAAKSPIHQAPVIDAGRLYLATQDGHVVALDAATGAFRWQYQRDPPDSFIIRGEARPLPHGDRVYAGFHDGYLVALSAAGGDVLWARPLGADKKQFVDVSASPQLAGGVLYAGSYAAGLYALDPLEGGVEWRYPVEGATTPTLDESAQRIYLAAPRAGVVVLDLAGHVLYSQAIAAEAGDPARPVLWGDYLLLSTSGGGLYVANRSDGEVLQLFNPGDGITGAPAAAGPNVYVLSNQGFLYGMALL